MVEVSHSSYLQPILNNEGFIQRAERADSLGMAGKNTWSLFVTFDLHEIFVHALLAVSMPSILLVCHDSNTYNAMN